MTDFQFDSDSDDDSSSESLVGDLPSGVAGIEPGGLGASELNPSSFEVQEDESPPARTAPSIVDLPTREFADGDSEQARPKEDDIEFDSQPAESSDSPRVDSIPSRIGDYHIKGVLGSGGMGKVYLAEHVRMQRQVALKMLRSDRMFEESAVERFYDEVRAASRVLHPNIVTAFDAGEHDGIHYLVMEYVEGMTLTRLVAKNGPLTPGMAASIIRQAALGLLHAHRAGIIHRDVKPGNLIRATDGTIKVLDLGLAQISSVLWSEDGRELGRVQDPNSANKRKGRLVGTLAYMPPEQLEAPDNADPRSDIYSLGAVFFFLLTGRPPYQGEYLEQVYGHRHGEIPDLMQLRSDVDLGLANILRRMMAKRLSERYASLDEVIEDLGAYAEESHGPTWLTEFLNRQASSEASTLSGGSTAIANTPIFGIDLGMTHSAVAEANPSSGIINLTAGEDSQQLFRMAFASDEGELLSGPEANQLRLDSPRSVVHCLPLYIGKDIVEREIAGRHCPPEVLLAMAIRRMAFNACDAPDSFKLVAVTVPASYDQFHRRSIKQACRLAGIDSIRLVNRGIAGVQSLMLDHESPSVGKSNGLDLSSGETILFIGLTGQATEVSLIQRNSMQLTELATEGHWHTSLLSWQSRLVELASAAFREKHFFDPSKSSITASRLQVACERAMKSLLVLPKVTITIDLDGNPLSVEVIRDEWLGRCSDLGRGIRKCIHNVCKSAGVRPGKINTCVMLGSILQIAELRDYLLRKLPKEMDVKTIDRGDVARGAAACLAAELPQRSDVLVPPRCVSGQTIGIVISDAKGRRRILPIMPHGTSLPARTNRKLTIAKTDDELPLSIVESSGVWRDKWHSLGRYDFEAGKDAESQRKRTRLVGFELNVDGLMTVRVQTPGMPESKKLPTIPDSTLPQKDEADWIKWLANLDW